MSDTISRKAFINSITAEDIERIAERMEWDAATLAATVEKMQHAANVVRKTKPSAETLANRQLAEDVADEINARGKEFTAKELAEFVTDADGIGMNSRRVGALLKQAYTRGLIEKSPEAWSVAHYGPKGFTEWAEKPMRAPKKKNAESEE